MTVVALGGGTTVPLKARMSTFAIPFPAAAEPDGWMMIALLHGHALDTIDCIPLTPEIAATLHGCLGEALEQPGPRLPTAPEGGRSRSQRS